MRPQFSLCFLFALVALSFNLETISIAPSDPNESYQNKVKKSEYIVMLEQANIKSAGKALGGGVYVVDAVFPKPPDDVKNLAVQGYLVDTPPYDLKKLGHMTVDTSSATYSIRNEFTLDQIKDLCTITQRPDYIEYDCRLNYNFLDPNDHDQIYLRVTDCLILKMKLKGDDEVVIKVIPRDAPICMCEIVEEIKSIASVCVGLDQACTDVYTENELQNKKFKYGEVILLKLELEDQFKDQYSLGYLDKIMALNDEALTEPSIKMCSSAEDCNGKLIFRFPLVEVEDLRIRLYSKLIPKRRELAEDLPKATVGSLIIQANEDGKIGNNDDDDFPWWGILLIVLGVIGIIGGGGYLGYRYKKRQSEGTPTNSSKV